MKNKSSYIKILSFIFPTALILGMVILMYLGRFSHPVGDDYYYGQDAKLALNSGSFFQAFCAALKGVSKQYIAWQGTYSAMFFMYLPPHIFGDVFYKLFPSFIILELVISVFYLLKPIFLIIFKSSKEAWLVTSSAISFLFIECVPVMGETFYWYNGSIYYTGFFSLTLLFFGGLIRFLISPKIIYIITLSILGFVIAGGNYASLLPCIILLLITFIGLIICKKEKVKVYGVLAILCAILPGFAISILAPGNSNRAKTTIGTTPIKAIIKSLLQGANYLKGWSNIWLLIMIILLTPVFIYIISSIEFDFKYPILTVCLAFGVFSSASCPSFYGQNNGGPARLFDICWYMFIIFTFFSYFYLLGWIANNHTEAKTYALTVVVIIAFFVLIPFRTKEESFPVLNSLTALKAITNGDAKYYEAQYQKRLLILKGDDAEITFEPYDVPQTLNYVLYLGDLTDDCTHFNNTAFAAFYGKESVKVQGK